MYKKVKAIAHATVSNLSCGFDVLGLSLYEPYDEVTLELTDDAGKVVIKKIDGTKKLPFEINKNTAGVAAIDFLKHIEANKEFGLNIELNKKMPLGSGLGSSAASAVAVLAGLNFMFEDILDKPELLKFAMHAEKIACGSAHADNVAPSLYGGFVLIRSYKPLDIISLPCPDNLHCIVIHPDVEVLTSYSRSLVPKEIKLDTVIKQTGNIAGFIASLYKKDYELMSRSMEDLLAEPYREKLIPYFKEVKASALKNGAIGCGISGSGPSIYCLVHNTKALNKISDGMKEIFDKHKISNQIYVSKINKEGPRVEVL